MMFPLTECHPFDDGNGRIARLIANAELSRAGQIRLILTADRNNYLATLTGASLGAGRGQLLIAVLDYAQRCSAAVDWRSFDSAPRRHREVQRLPRPGDRREHRPAPSSARVSR